MQSFEAAIEMCINLSLRLAKPAQRA